LEYWLFSNKSNDCINYISSGISKICIDIETRGKKSRQSKRNTFISDHKLEDIIAISEKIGKEKTICRVNPLHENSRIEVEKAIAYGAGTIIIPYFKEVEDLHNFLFLIKGRAKIIALVETIQSFLKIEEISKIKDIERIHIGLNDLSLEIGFDDMFEIVRTNWMEIISKKIDPNTKFGFGGISSLKDNKCIYPVSEILNHHKKCGSSSVIISRSFERFCKIESRITKISYWNIYKREINAIRNFINT